ncbi:hypothetical protein Tco_1102484 [Tanacetum coccineum]
MPWFTVTPIERTKKRRIRCNGSVTLLENENFLLLFTYDDQTEAKEEAECETKRETETASVENDEKINTQAAFVELSQGEVNTLDLDMS